MIRNSRLCLIVFAMVGISMLYGQWNKSLVGTAPDVLNLIRVGDGRNDGVQRVYAICEDAHVYEWTYTGSGWQRADLGPMPGSGWCLGIDIGKGKNDGLNRIYATRIDGNIHEYFYNGSQWVRTSLGNPNSTIYGVCVGAGRNDGINRVYASGDGVPPVEYSWNGTNWIKDTVQSANLQQWIPTVGPGRNDGINRLYLPNSMGSTYTVAEYTWTGSSYTRSDLPVVGGNPLCVAIGSGRNDGVNRVYASSRAKVYEFTYQSGSWQTVDILPNYGTEARYNIAIGRTKIDGKYRMYITCSGTQLIEASWSGTAWVDTVIDAVSAATCGVAIGRGRNDDTVRVYGCNRNGQVYEFTHNQPYVVVNEENEHNTLTYPGITSALPNPFSSIVRIYYQLPSRSKIKIAIYSVDGAELITLVDRMHDPGVNEIVWNGRNSNGYPVPSGIYFVRLESATAKYCEKLILIR